MSKASKKVSTKLENVEAAIVDKYVDEHLIEKTYAKILNDVEEWNHKTNGRLIATVWHDFINEELHDAVRKFKKPTIDFRVLNHLVTAKIKNTKPDLF